MLEVTSYEPGGGGLHIEYTDGPAVRYVTATPRLMLDLAAQHRRHRNAPCDLLESAAAALADPGVSDADTAELWRVAYQDLVDDIREIKARGLRHDTPHGELQRRRDRESAGARAAPVVPSGLEGFIARQRSKGRT